MPNSATEILLLNSITLHLILAMIFDNDRSLQRFIDRNIGKEIAPVVWRSYGDLVRSVISGLEEEDCNVIDLQEVIHGVWEVNRKKSLKSTYWLDVLELHILADYDSGQLGNVEAVAVGLLRDALRDPSMMLCMRAAGTLAVLGPAGCAERSRFSAEADCWLDVIHFLVLSHGTGLSTDRASGLLLRRAAEISALKLSDWNESVPGYVDIMKCDEYAKSVLKSYTGYQALIDIWGRQL